jgi:hypothetical protein
VSRLYTSAPQVSWEWTGSDATGHQWCLLLERESPDGDSMGEYIYIDAEDIGLVLDRIADLGEPLLIPQNIPQPPTSKGNQTP